MDLPEDKTNSIQKRSDEMELQPQVLKLARWKPQTLKLGVITLSLLVSGGVAIIQGGFWIALILYIINLIALLMYRADK